MSTTVLADVAGLHDVAREVRRRAARCIWSQRGR
jgi:hypothetical protein